MAMELSTGRLEAASRTPERRFSTPAGERKGRAPRGPSMRASWRRQKIWRRSRASHQLDDIA